MIRGSDTGEGGGDTGEGGDDTGEGVIWEKEFEWGAVGE